MNRFLLLLFFFSPLLLGSEGKSINPFKQSSHEINLIHLDKNAFKNADDFKRHEVRPIEAGYNYRNSHKNNKLDENLTKTASRKRLRRCFCGLSPDASCPDGFLETHIEWNDPLVGPIVPSNFPAEGPPYDVGDEWTWVQDRFDGDLQQNAYGWNWKDKFDDNSQTGPQQAGYPCGQQGWCCKLVLANTASTNLTQMCLAF